MQYDLFGEVLAQEEASASAAAAFIEQVADLKAWRKRQLLDCCTGDPCPENEHGHVQVRCGRCGELVAVNVVTTNHDLGWCGCPTDEYRKFADASEMSSNRHDNLHHKPCARCGHAWGIHTMGFGIYPQEECSCKGCWTCPGYVAP